MSHADGGRRAWRAHTGTRPRRLDYVWDLVSWFSLFPGVAMVFAAVGGGRRGPRMGVDETWIWMLIATAIMFLLVLALAARRASGVAPTRYPGTMFGLIIFVSIAAPAFAWIRLEGYISASGWASIVLSAATVSLATIMAVPPRHPAD